MLDIQKGLILNNQLEAIPIERSIVQRSGRIANVRTGITLEGPYGVTLHNTGNNQLSADARNHARWLSRVEAEDRIYVGAHFFVDAHRIVQTLPITEVAWHAGDGAQGPGNRRTIGIEICENRPYAQGEAHALKLAAALLKTFPQAKLYKHQDFTGKYCPRVILNQGRWEEVKQQVARLVASDSPSSPAPAPTEPATWAKKACAWAQEQGLFVGDGQGKMRWQEPVTRQELAAILERMGRL